MMGLRAQGILEEETAFEKTHSMAMEKRSLLEGRGDGLGEAGERRWSRCKKGNTSTAGVGLNQVPPGHPNGQVS